MSILNSVHCLIGLARTALSGRSVIHFVATVLMAVWVVAPGYAAGNNPTPQWAPGRVLLQPKPGIPEARLRQIVAGQSGQEIGRINAINVRIIQVAPQAEQAVARALARNPHIKFAEPDYLMEPGYTVPNDPRYGNAWHLPKIEAPDAWSLSKGEGIVVAILDTGIHASHPDFAGKLVPGWNSASQNTDISDVHGHGTWVAGTVGAATDNATGVAAVGWDAKIMPIRVTNRSDGWATSSDMARGLIWAADNGAHIANMSYTSWRFSAVANAAQYMRDKGGVVFGGAGNDGADPGWAPSSHVIVVSATNSSDSRTSWSNYGSYVDLSAPGASIQTTSGSTGYASGNGTSFSSPVAAAVAALVMAANPQLTPSQVEQILFDSAVDLGAPGWDPYYGWGRVNAAAAVNLAWSSEVDREAPEVEIVSPSLEATVSGEIVVKIDASDNVGVTEVKLYAAGQLLGSEGFAPYEFVWDTTGVADSTAELYAEAFDEAGNKAVHSISVTVDNAPAEDTTPPVVSITSPGDGENVSGHIVVKINASDNVGVSRVDLHAADQWLSSKYSAPYEFSLDTNNIADGTVQLRAEAFDEAGNSAEYSISVTVNNTPEPEPEPEPKPEPEPEDDIPPVVSITSPAEGENVSGNLRITARATDNVGVVRMELQVNGETLCIEFSDSINCRWQTRHASSGSHTITALATDAAGNEGVETITVNIGGSDDGGGDDDGGPPPGRGWRR